MKGSVNKRIERERRVRENIPTPTDLPRTAGRRVYGSLSLTPKFLSPLSRRRMNTPTWSMPTRAEREGEKGKVE